MGRPEQKLLTLVGGLQASNASATVGLLKKIRRVDLEFAPKRVVLMEELPGCKSESHLSEAISGEKNFPLRWLPAYARYDREQLIAGEVARWTGSKVVPLRPRTKAERLARYEHVLDALGDVGDLVRRKADDLPDEVFAEEEP